MPIFVIGLPRTGTTALHRLLAADPGYQGLELWLTQAPQPRPPRETWAGDPVFAQLQEAYAQYHVEHPEFVGVHYIAADRVEECWQLLRQSMRSVSFECLAHLPAYSAWLAGQDWTAAYRRHRRNLQLIGLPGAGRRLTLTGAAVDAMRAVQHASADVGAAGSRGAAPVHRYALADFGLTSRQVDERFGDYASAWPRAAHS
jgi:hypothetical protein